MVILIVANLRLILENLFKYGLRVRAGFWVRPRIHGYIEGYPFTCGADFKRLRLGGSGGVLHAPLPLP